MKGELSVTQKEGIITCIPKDNKPCQFITNYRPISLLNCVYKIGSGAIANRLKSTLNKLIHKDQTGFISGRYLGENIRIIYDIMHHTEKNNLKGLLLFVDFEKASDSFSWSFIHKVLELFGFGDSLISWIKVLNKNAKLAVNQGGNLSSFLAHLSRRLKVRYCDHSPSVVIVVRPSVRPSVRSQSLNNISS